VRRNQSKEVTKMQGNRLVPLPSSQTEATSRDKLVKNARKNEIIRQREGIHEVGNEKEVRWREGTETKRKSKEKKEDIKSRKKKK
jgi:hypothetical protein